MKVKLITANIILLLSFGACKNVEINEEVAIKDNFSIVIEGVFTKNDKLQVFYLVEGKDWSDENSISQPIYASNEMQKIELDLPKEIIPNNLRVDLGSNPTQSNVTIKNISIKYKNETINGDLGIFTDYFYPNQFVSWDPNYFGYKLSAIDGNYDPFFMGNDLLIDSLKSLVEEDQTKE